MHFTIYLYKYKIMTITESKIVELVTEEMKKSDVLDIVKKDKELVERIVEQKLSFNELTMLLGEYAETNPDIADVASKLEGISQIFNEIEIEKSGIQTITDEESGSTVLKATQKINITQAQYDALKTASANLRNSFIQ